MAQGHMGHIKMKKIDMRHKICQCEEDETTLRIVKQFFSKTIEQNKIKEEEIKNTIVKSHNENIHS